MNEIENRNEEVKKADSKFFAIGCGIIVVIALLLIGLGILIGSIIF